MATIDNPYPMVVIVGETAAGKSSLAMHIAQQYNGEIICADSWTVYKEMNIGTAKASPKDREKVSHHLLDIVSPDSDFTAVDFQQRANEAIRDISSRNKLPVMVGGNGLYVDSVLFDYTFLPPGENEERRYLNSLNLEQLHELAREKQIDMTGIDRHNKRRVVRAIEANGQKPGRSPMRKNTLVVGIKRSKQELRDRIEQRVEKMFAQGLPHEVKALINIYGWDVEAMKGIGYREFKGYFNNDISKNEVKRRIVRSTVRLAKKQRSWFKRNRQIEWVTSEAEALKEVHDFLQEHKERLII